MPFSHSDAPRPAPRIALPPRPRGRPPKTERPHRIPRNTPSPITSPARRTARPRTEISPGARAHTTKALDRAHGPPADEEVTTHTAPLTPEPRHRYAAAVTSGGRLQPAGGRRY